MVDTGQHLFFNDLWPIIDAKNDDFVNYWDRHQSRPGRWLVAV